MGYIPLTQTPTRSKIAQMSAMVIKKHFGSKETIPTWKPNDEKTRQR